MSVLIVEDGAVGGDAVVVAAGPREAAVPREEPGGVVMEKV
jgi:hypothetical protein